MMKIFYLTTIVLIGSICSSTSANYRKEDMSLDEFNQRMLDEHNRLRKQVAISYKATGMFKMVIDPELVALAKKNTEICVFGHKYLHSDNYDSIQQSIWAGEAPYFPVPEPIVRGAWFGERKFYTYENKSCEKGKVCGHYINVVMAETRYIGCYFKNCSHMFYVTCDYGNTLHAQDEPYEIGDRPCEDCPDNCIESALCETNYTIITPPDECKDISKKCAILERNFCKNYRPWAFRNCMQFCGFCIGTTTELTTQTTTTVATENCKDKIDNCADYGQSVCRGEYEPWARHHCMEYCGFCVGITTAPTTLAIENCKDRIDNCARYGKDVCNGKYERWAKDNCMEYCGFCSECKLTVRGLEYKGTLSRTKSGKECQQWKLDKPHKHTYKNEDENYCRNPDKSRGPWCYTTDPQHPAEYCDVPMCKTNKPRECKITARGLEYKGTLSRTRSGKECQQWKLEKTHKLTYKNEEENYCRNPDKSRGPWCYTTDPQYRAEYCDVPMCKRE